MPVLNKYRFNNAPHSSLYTSFSYHQDKYAQPGNLPKSNALSEIGEHWIEKYFHLLCNGSPHDSVYRKSCFLWSVLSTQRIIFRTDNVCCPLHLKMWLTHQLQPHDASERSCDGQSCATGCLWQMSHSLIYRVHLQTFQHDLLGTTYD